MPTLSKSTYYTTDELLDVAKKDNIQLDNKLIECIKNNDEKAFCLIGEKYYHNKDYLKAVIWFLKSAYFQNGPSQYYIGRIFESSTDAMVNKRQALEWYQRSADQGYRLAITRIIKLRWKGHYLDSNQKTFINLERKSKELKRNYLDKVEALEQRYQASLKLLDYEKLSLELDERRSLVTETNQDGTKVAGSNSKIDTLEDEILSKIDTLEQKNQLLEDGIKVLERENVLNQEAFEKEKKFVAHLFDTINSEEVTRSEQERNELNNKFTTLEEEYNVAINEFHDKNKKLQDRISKLELEVVEKQKLEERLKLLENIFSKFASAQHDSTGDNIPQNDISSVSINNQDQNKIRVVVEYNMTPQP